MKFFGKVVKGNGIGRKIGFPTINVLSSGLTLEYGVYVCQVGVDGNSYKGVMHYGLKFIPKNEGPTCEIYLLNFDSSAYDKAVSVTVLSKLRNTIRFDDLEKLSNQIKADVENVKKNYS